jgi:hypothetical protein
VLSAARHRPPHAGHCRRGARNELRAKHRRGTRAIVDSHWLAEQLRQPGCHDARGGIGAAAGRGRHDKAHRFRGIVLSVQRAGATEQQYCRNEIQQRIGILKKYSI